MTTSPTIRARDGDQKLARKQTLMDAGWRLFLEQGQMPSVSQVVQAAGLAKGTFYIYFKTKEELFLELMAGALKEFFEELNESLTQKEIDLERYVDLFARKFHKDHMLIKLGALTAGVLEQNTEEEAVKKFKMNLVCQLQKAARLLHERFLVIDEKQAARMILRSYAVLLGVAQLIPSSPTQTRMMQDPALEILALDFSEEAKAILRSLWASALLMSPACTAIQK